MVGEGSAANAGVDLLVLLAPVQPALCVVLSLLRLM